MKKMSRKIISIVLAIVMVLSLSVCAFATEDKIVYTCLGDSNSAGHNLPEYVANRVAVPGAYHSLIAEALDAELRPFGSGGYRTDEILYLIDPTFEMDWAYADICNGKVHKEDLDAYKDAYVQAVIDADLITLQVGANDITGDCLGFAFLHAFMPIEAIETLKTMAGNVGGELGEAMLKAVDAAEKAIQYTKLLTEFLWRVNEKYSVFEEQWDSIFENIYRLNPDVEIAVISTVNPFKNTSIFVDAPFKSGSLLAPIFNRLNKWMESGSKYSDTYVYCDITDVEPGTLALTQPDFWQVYLGEVHPNLEGHKKIADHVLDALRKDGFC